MESVMFSIHLLLAVLIAAGILYVVFPPHFKADKGTYKTTSGEQ